MRAGADRDVAVATAAGAAADADAAADAGGTTSFVVAWPGVGIIALARGGCTFPFRQDPAPAIDCDAPAADDDGMVVVAVVAVVVVGVGGGACAGNGCEGVDCDE